MPCGLAACRDVRVLENRLQPPECGHEAGSIIGADHAPRGRQPQRLQDAGVTDPAGEHLGVLVERMQLESRHRNGSLRQSHSLAMLVARGERGRYRVALELPRSLTPQTLHDHGREHRGIVVHADDRGDPVLACERGRLFRGAVGVCEVEGEESRGLCALEGAGPVGRDRQRDLEPPRGLYERRRAVGRRGEQQQDPEGGRVRHAAPLFLGGGEVGIGAR